jgi:hypothetical protein
MRCPLYAVALSVFLLSAVGYAADKFVKLDAEDQKVHFFGPGTLIDSGCMGPCTSIIVYDPQTKSALAGHFFARQVAIYLNQMISLSNEKFKSRAPLQVFAVGASLGTKEESQLRLLNIRNATTQTILNNDFSKEKVIIRWLKNDCLMAIEGIFFNRIPLQNNGISRFQKVTDNSKLEKFL